MEDIIVKDDNRRIVPFEDIMARVPNVSYCAYNIDDNINSVYTSETASKMAQLPPFTNLKYFHIFQNSDQFNPEDFCDFIKKNSSAVDYLITFHDSVSMEHKRWFKYIIDKMLNSWENGKDKPSISVSLLF
uniref:Uncharacterized protein n=1 Tax=Panagrolaimus sp. PS1159 TaxID=55785 RepID=A0AC35G0L6_9BILA